MLSASWICRRFMSPIAQMAMAVRAISGINRRQIQLADGVEHRPHQMPLRHPIAHRRRHQEHLLTVNPDEPRAHAHRLPAAPDSTPLFPTASTNLSSAWVRGARQSSLLLSTPAGRSARPLRPLGRYDGLKRGLRSLVFDGRSAPREGWGLPRGLICQRPTHDATQRRKRPESGAKDTRN